MANISVVPRISMAIIGLTCTLPKEFARLTALRQLYLQTTLNDDWEWICDWKLETLVHYCGRCVLIWMRSIVTAVLAASIEQVAFSQVNATKFITDFSFFPSRKLLQSLFFHQEWCITICDGYNIMRFPCQCLCSLFISWLLVWWGQKPKFPSYPRP